MNNKLKPFMIVMFICLANVGQCQDDARTSSLDLYYIPQSIRSNIVLGRGYDMTDPWYPVIASESPFMINKNKVAEISSLLKPTTIAPNNSSNAYTLHYENHIDEQTVAQYLHADLRVKGLSYSIQTSVDYVHKHYNVAQGVRFVLENQSTFPDAQDVNSTWIKSPLTETSKGINNEGLWRLFKGRYGSHYVSSISYGYRLEILAFANSSVENSKLKLDAAFSAWSVKGSIDAQITQDIESSGATIDIRIFCNNIRNKANGSNLPFVITGIPQVLQFLHDLQIGTIEITPAPTSVSFKSYAPSVCGMYPITCNLFSEKPVATDPNAMPKGTILAWTPAPQYITDINGSIVITAPTGGWVVCDKRNHDIDSRIPDLSETFLMGASQDVKPGSTGGKKNHTHTVSQGSPEPTNYLWQPHDRAIILSKELNIPPYYSVVYIIKQ